MSKNRERIRFSVSDDVMLLREVLTINPYENTSRWKEIHENVVLCTSKMFTMRAVKDHVDHLVQLWTKKDRANLRKSGTEEQYVEKEQLLQQIKDLSRDFKASSNTKGLKENEARRKGVEARNLIIQVQPEDAGNEGIASNIISCEDSTQSPLAESPITSFPLLSPSVIDDSSTDLCSTPTSSAGPLRRTSSDNLSVTCHSPVQCSSKGGRVHPYKNKQSKLKSSTLELLNERHQSERKIKEKELELQERKLTLEERRLRLEEQKFELEKTERQNQRVMEMEEQQHRIATTEKQQKLIDVLLQRLMNK